MEKRRVRITQLPQAKTGGTSMFGAQTPPVDKTTMPGKGSYHGGNDPKIKINRVLKPTSRENATLEAEKGETVITNLQGEGIPEFYKIAGKPHSKGGTPLNLPANSFIFSKDKSLLIKDENIQEMFGKPANKKGYTPAELSMSYDLNKYREILADPTSDKMSKETAEKMIKNYNLKLGSLALVQESMKGFEDGVPAVALPYLEHMGIDPAELIGPQNAPGSQLQQFKGGGAYTPRYDGGGGAGDYDPSKPKPEQEAFWKAFDIHSKEKMNTNPLQFLGTGMDVITGIKNASDPSAMRALNEATSLESLAAVTQGDRGIHTFNPTGVQKPGSMTPVQFYGTESGYAKYGGTQGKRRVRIVELPKADKGIPRKRYDLPEKAVVWDPNAEGYDESKVKVGHYVLVDGVPKKITSRKAMSYGDKYKTDLLKNESFQNAYGLLQDRLENNEELKKKIVEQYYENLKTLKPGKNLSREDIVAMQNMQPDEIIKNFLDMQLRNYRVSEAVKTTKDKSSWDTGKGKADVNKVLTDLGYTPEQINDKVSVAAFQNTFNSLAQLEKDGKLKDDLKGLNIAGLGKADEPGKFANLSPVDGWYGNTTAGQVMVPVESENVYEDVSEIKDELDTTKHLTDPQINRQPAEPWLQDKVNLAGALSDYFGLKKQDPWVAMPGYTEATPTFTSFEGAAARNLAAQKTGLEGAAQFAGPQSYMSRASKFGDPAGILAVQEAENRANVAIDNQFKMQNTAQRNQYEQLKAGLATNYYDKAAMADESMRNAKRALKWNAINMYNNLVTNKYKTDALNQLYPEYAVDPRVGGRLIHTPQPGLGITSTKPSQETIAGIASLKDRYPDMTWTEAQKIYTGNALDIPGQVPAQAVMQQYPNFVGPNSYPQYDQ